MHSIQLLIQLPELIRLNQVDLLPVIPTNKDINKIGEKKSLEDDELYKMNNGKVYVFKVAQDHDKVSLGQA